jgi:hypothetical protein
MRMNTIFAPLYSKVYSQMFLASLCNPSSVYLVSFFFSDTVSSENSFYMWRWSENDQLIVSDLYPFSWWQIFVEPLVHFIAPASEVSQDASPLLRRQIVLGSFPTHVLSAFLP